MAIIQSLSSPSMVLLLYTDVLIKPSTKVDHPFSPPPTSALCAASVAPCPVDAPSAVPSYGLLPPLSYTRSGF